VREFNPNRPHDDPKPLPNGSVRRTFDNKGRSIVEFPAGTWETPLTMAQIVEGAMGHALDGGPITVIGDAFPVGG
jgi:hypothetical protein